jgi:hypothetical protein
MMQDMTDTETAAHIREWLRQPHGPFSSPLRRRPTDGCGYNQHMRYIAYRNANWESFTGTHDEFVLAYADALDNPKPATEGNNTTAKLE